MQHTNHPVGATRVRSLIPFAAAVCSLGLLAALSAADTEAAPAHATRATATKATVITVTAGKPSELAFRLSKSSLIPVGPVTFKVTNAGALGHDFKICTAAVTTASKNACTGKVTPLLAKGKTATLTITLKKGVYEFLCTVPGHASAGMKGLIGIGVKPAAAAKATPTPAATSTTTTTAAATTTPSAPLAALIGDPVAGAAVWTSAGCGSCHALKAAGATGTVGPSLDQTKPDQATIVTQVATGGKIMPAFGTSLSAAQINNLAAYVYQSQ